MVKINLTTISAVDYLIKFAGKEDITGFCTVTDYKEIRPEKDENDQPKNSLGRVFNNGRGLLTVAVFAPDGILLLNEFLLTEVELMDLTVALRNKNINFISLHFDRDYYNRYTLTTYYEYLNRTRRIQQERTKINFFQWLLGKR